MPQTFTYLNQAGSFECEVCEPENGWIGESGEKLTPYIRIPVKVIEGPETGKSAVWQGWLSVKAFDNTIKRISEIFSWDGDLANLHLGKTSLAGQRCNIQTEMQEYNGKTMCKIAWLNPPGGGGGAKPMDAEKVAGLLKTLNAKSKAIAKATKKAEGTPAAPAPETDRPPSDDDVPF